MEKDAESGLYLPQNATLSRRSALKMGAVGVGGLVFGGSLLAATATTTVAVAAPKDSIKAHWVYIGPPDDNGWTQEHNRGRLQAQAALGDRMQSDFTPDIFFDASTAQLFQQLADDGNDVVFANTEYAALLSDVAAENPNTVFMEANGHTYTDNLFGYYVAHEVPAYLLGIAAPMLTENAKIGYIGAFPTASLFNDVNGMLLGARSVNPDATVDTVVANTFFDPQVAAQAANALIDNGVEFLFGIMDEPTFPPDLGGRGCLDRVLEPRSAGSCTYEVPEQLRPVRVRQFLHSSVSGCARWQLVHSERRGNARMPVG